MRLAVSNIGWTSAEDDFVLPLLREAGAGAVEVAPGRLFENPGEVGAEAARAMAGRFRDAGLPIISMQALLFGKPDLVLFGTGDGALDLRNYLAKIFALAGALGCGPLVFGSPKNRQKGGRSFAAACAEAAPVFRALGDLAAKDGLVFCLEANAVAYGCDFMTVLAQASAVAGQADHKSVGIVADTGNMLMEGEAASALDGVMEHVRHVHISAPELASVLPHKDYIAEVIGRLRDIGYAGDLTLEMRPVSGPDPTSEICRATALLRTMIDRP